jgi:intraflagellar transport protein 172
VDARISQLDKNFKTAESIYLDNNSINEAIEMYQNIYRWDEAIYVAQAKNHPELEKLKKNYNQWLNETEQFEIAASVKESEGDHVGAINLYLRSNMATKASKVLTNNRELIHNQDLVSKIAKSLIDAELFENAGELFEKIRDEYKALECYKTGKIYNRAVELARSYRPQDVVALESEWGDYLSQQKLFDAAINHYIEAGQSLKAVDAAISSRQWKKAIEILRTQDGHETLEYYKKIADHFASVQELEAAEKFYIKSNHPKECIEMYNKAGKWERAFKIATSYLSREEVSTLYLEQAKLLEQQGRYKEAEKLYIIINDENQAIQMYKRIKNYDNMIRLIIEYHPNMVNDTYLHLAKELEAANNLRQAEIYYIKGEDWKSAVMMYKNLNMWEEAYKISKSYGGPVATKQVAYLWAKTIGGDAAIKLLTKLGLLESSIDYAIESGAFEFAFELAKAASNDKQLDIHSKYAMFLEDEGRFQEAENEFLLAQKPKEAVLMYVHNRDWDNAQRIAEKYDPALTADVLIGQAKLAFDEKNYQKAESFLLRANRPELAVKLYKDNAMWPDALRVCKEYLPNRLDQLKEEYDSSGTDKSQFGIEGLLEQATKWEASGEYSKAVDSFIKILPSSSIDKETAVRCWIKACDLAQKFLSEHKTQQTVSVIGPRLIEINRSNQAAELYLRVDMVRECIDAFISGEEWGKAKKVAEQLDKSLIPYVEQKYKEQLHKSGDIKAVADYDAASALDLYIKNGQWDECLALAEKQSKEVLNKYVAKYAAFLIQTQGRTDLAIDVFSRYGAAALSQNFNIYHKMVLDTLKLDSLNTSDNYEEWSKLRTVLLSLTENLAKSAEYRESNERKTFEKLLLIVHYNTLRCCCANNEQLDTIAAKLSISLLRHTDFIPADKAFYEAGIVCQKLKWDNMAFVFLNRYIDLADAIDDGGELGMDTNSSYLDQSDIPDNLHLPQQKYLTVNYCLFVFEFKVYPIFIHLF